MANIIRFIFIFGCIAFLAGCSTGFEKGFSNGVTGASEVSIQPGGKTISREIAGISLGMPQSEVSKAYKMREIPDPTISLYKSFAPEIADRKVKMNKEFQTKYFDLSGNLPQGVKNIRAVFSKDSLYQIALYYGEDYIRKVEWDEFVSTAFQKYGQPSFMHGPSSYQWQDGRTRLEIAKAIRKDEKNPRPSITSSILTPLLVMS
jgi:hypothetical protein